jgi:putative oxidoreductase
MGMSVGILLLRIVVGLLFIGRGTQKLFGWFGGHGRSGTARFVGSVGYRPPETMALVGGLAETVGGTLLLLGLLTPIGAALIIGMMVSAILTVHISKGVWNENGGLELPLVYIFSALAIAFTPGRYSLDRVIGIELNGRVASVAALGVGIIVAVGLAVGRDFERREPATEELPPAKHERTTARSTKRKTAA